APAPLDVERPVEEHAQDQVLREVRERRPVWTASSWPGVARGKSAERSGRRTAPVRSPENQPLERVQMMPAHASTGSQRPRGPGLDDFSGGTLHEHACSLDLPAQLAPCGTRACPACCSMMSA